MKYVLDGDIKIMSNKNPKMTSKIQMTRYLNNNTNISIFSLLLWFCIYSLAL